MSILLLSAYHSASHRYWCEGLMAAFPEIDWTFKTQRGRHFSWRVRASGWMWALAEDADFSRRYDLVIATSLCDIVTLKALCPALRDTPIWLYFHENQFAHPLSERQWTHHQQGWQFQSIENALCADCISFNTNFNRDTFFEGARRLLRQFPERLPGEPLERLKAISDVLPVPLSARFQSGRTTPKVPHRIVWNHRWEWDKRPDLFLRVLTKLHAQGIHFELAMLGSGGGRKNNEFAEERRILGNSIIHWGEADEVSYEEWIRTAGIGVSTALHDFQGLAMLELAQAGATVIVPRRLAYPEILLGACFYESPVDDPVTDAANLESALMKVLTGGDSPCRYASRTLPDWSRLTSAYSTKLRSLESPENESRSCLRSRSELPRDPDRCP